MHARARAIDHRNASTVIAAIFKAGEPIKQSWRNLSAAQKPNYSTHTKVTKSSFPSNLTAQIVGPRQERPNRQNLKYAPFLGQMRDNASSQPPVAKR
jgi:hypothetical protein